MKHAVLNTRVIETFESVLEALKNHEGLKSQFHGQEEIRQIAAQLTVAVMLVQEMENVRTDLHNAVTQLDS
jgi:hypothetical protein